jgi:hypothetical protein
MNASLSTRHSSHPLTEHKHAELRRRVRQTLEQTPSYRKLPPREQSEIAANMVKTMAFLSEAGVSPDMLPMVAAQAVDPKQMADAVKQGQGTGKDFSGGASREGGAVMAKLVKDVDFPKFVKGLIDGVFTSIVDSSIKQMQEYGKFLESVVKSVEEFANENYSDEDAREYATQKAPGALTRNDKGMLELTESDSGESMPPDFAALFGMSEAPDLEDEAGEGRLVQAAKVQMARQKQQLLATMALLGINRIIVTEGEIKASVMFKVDATDTAHTDTATDQAHTDTSYASSHSAKRSRSFWGTDSSSQSSHNVNTTVNTDHATTGSTSDSRLDSSAKLTGSVTVKFKSETFPLERMASPMELASLNQKAQK